jgi:putative transposase
LKKRGSGRPKGSTNKVKENVEISLYLKFIQNLLLEVMLLIGNNIQVKYGVLDGAFGHNDALQMIKLGGLHLISKLKKNSKLYFPYEGAYSGRGAPRKYGERINYKNIPIKFLKKSTCEKSIKTDIYQMTMLHKLFSQKLNIVIIVKENLNTKSRDFVILFSSDLDLDYEKLIDYYKLRFQIEFNFRDAKQYWGLEDFMNIKETPVKNAINLAFFMVNLSHILINIVRPQNAEFSVQDIKAHFRGTKYVDEVLKLLPQKPDPILIQQIFKEITIIGGINTD